MCIRDRRSTVATGFAPGAGRFGNLPESGIDAPAARANCPDQLSVRGDSSLQRWKRENRPPADYAFVVRRFHSAAAAAVSERLSGASSTGVLPAPPWGQPTRRVARVDW